MTPLLKHPLEAIAQYRTHSGETYQAGLRLLCSMVVLIRAWRLSSSSPAAGIEVVIECEMRLTRVAAVFLAIAELDEEMPQDGRRRHLKKPSLLNLFSSKKDTVFLSAETRQRIRALVPLLAQSPRLPQTTLRKSSSLPKKKTFFRPHRGSLAECFSAVLTQATLPDAIAVLTRDAEDDLQRAALSIGFDTTPKSVMHIVRLLAMPSNMARLETASPPLAKFVKVLHSANQCIKELPPVHHFWAWTRLPEKTLFPAVCYKLCDYLGEHDPLAHSRWLSFCTPLFEVSGDEYPFVFEDIILLKIDSLTSVYDLTGEFPCDDLYGASMGDWVLWKMYGWLYVAFDIESHIYSCMSKFPLSEFVYSVEIIKRVFNALRIKYNYTFELQNRLKEIGMRIFHCNQPTWPSRFAFPLHVLSKVHEQIHETLYSKPVLNDCVAFMRLAETVRTSLARIVEDHYLCSDIVGPEPEWPLKSDLAIILAHIPQESLRNHMLISPFTITEHGMWLQNSIRLIPVLECGYPLYIDPILLKKITCAMTIMHSSVERIFGFTFYENSWTVVCEQSHQISVDRLKNSVNYASKILSAGHLLAQVGIAFKTDICLVESDGVKLSLSNLDKWVLLGHENYTVLPMDAYYKFCTNVFADNDQILTALNELYKTPITFLKSAVSLLEFFINELDSDDHSIFCHMPTMSPFAERPRILRRTLSSGSTNNVVPSFVDSPLVPLVESSEVLLVPMQQQDKQVINEPTVYTFNFKKDGPEATIKYTQALSVYREGNGDLNRAYALFEEASKEYPMAYFFMADAHYFGSKVYNFPQDLVKAKKLYELAIENGCLVAHVGLGDCMYFGFFGDRNLKAAKDHYLKAVETVNFYTKAEARARAGLADCWFDEGFFKEAEKELKSAIELDPGDVPGIAGCKRAFAKLAVMYIYGHSVEVDLTKAKELLNYARGCRREILGRCELYRALMDIDMAEVYSQEHLWRYPMDF